jgi:hypothetical protein
VFCDERGPELCEMLAELWYYLRPNKVLHGLLALVV